MHSDLINITAGLQRLQKQALVGEKPMDLETMRKGAIALLKKYPPRGNPDPLGTGGFMHQVQKEAFAGSGKTPFSGILDSVAKGGPNPVSVPSWATSGKTVGTNTGLIGALKGSGGTLGSFGNLLSSGIKA